MMFEDDRTTVPRAYVALPHDHLYEEHDKDLASAITWCLSHAGGDPRVVGIQTGLETCAAQLWPMRMRGTWVRDQPSHPPSSVFHSPLRRFEPITKFR